MRPVLEREALPREVEATGRVVERERDHHRDRQEQIAEREDGVAGQDVPADEADAPRERRLARPDAGHRRPRPQPATAPVSRSVPSTLSYTVPGRRIAPIRTNDSAAAVG